MLATRTYVRLSDLFERYFNIIDGQTDGQKQSLNPASTYACGVIILCAKQVDNFGLRVEYVHKLRVTCARVGGA